MSDILQKILALCLPYSALLSMCAYASERNVSRIHGTLVVTIPTADGLIVASDSRGSLSGDRFCDEVQKILPLKQHPHSVTAITGTLRILPKLPLGTPACDEYNKHKPQFDFLQLAQKSLDSQAGIVGLKSFNKMREFMLKKVRQSEREAPPDIADDDEGVNIIFGSFDPTTKTAIVGTIQICVGKAKGKAELCGEEWTEFHQNDPADIKATGAHDFSLVQNGKALQFVHSVDLVPYYGFSNHSVSKVTAAQGFQMAKTLILATEELTNLPGHDKSVHGPVRAFLLNEQDVPVELK
jgi:hypothetical protein